MYSQSTDRTPQYGGMPPDVGVQSCEYASVRKSLRTLPPLSIWNRLFPWTSVGSVMPAASAKVSVQSMFTARPETWAPALMCPSHRMISGTRRLSLNGTRLSCQRWEPADQPLSDANTIRVLDSRPIDSSADTMLPSQSSTEISDRQRSSINASNFFCRVFDHVSACSQAGSS